MNTRLQSLEILKDFHKITGARISLHDRALNEMAGYPPQLSDFCKSVQQNDSVRLKCMIADEAAFKEVQKIGIPYTYKCHCGLIETVAPIYNYGTLTGYFMMGQVTDDAPDSIAVIKKHSAKYFADNNELNLNCEKIPVIDTQMMRSYINILEIIAEYMTQTSGLTVKERDLASAVKSYICKFYSRPISIRLLCETFGCSRTTLMNAFKNKYGQTVGNYMTEYRLKQAENMLRESDRSVKSIAADCGFSDQNYFAKVFRAQFSVTPSEYRKSPKFENNT